MILAKSGYTTISIIDMDCVELGNIRRQALYTQNDIGSLKVASAKAYIESHFPSVHIQAIEKSLQNIPASFFTSVDVILGCLDNIEGREYLNQIALAHSKVYIDGGSMGFGGQVQLVVPRVWIPPSLHSSKRPVSTVSRVSLLPRPPCRRLSARSFPIPQSRSTASRTPRPLCGRRATHTIRWTWTTRSMFGGSTRRRWSEHGASTSSPSPLKSRAYPL